MEQLAQLLKERYDAHLASEFRREPFFEPNRDYVEYTTVDCITVTDRVDKHLTLILDARNREVVGIRLKGFRWFFQQHLKPLSSITEEQFVPFIKVVELMMAVAGPRLIEEHRDKYRRAFNFTKHAAPKLRLADVDCAAQ